MWWLCPYTALGFIVKWVAGMNPFEDWIYAKICRDIFKQLGSKNATLER